MMTLLSMYPPDRVNRDDRGRTFANGQFMLFDRQSYDSIGGHSAVRDDLLEDLAFARAIGDAGGRGNVLRADGLLHVSMYESRQALLEGWTRIFLEAARRSVRELRKHAWRLLAVGWLLPGASILSLVLGLVLGGDWGNVAAACGAGALVAQCAALAWMWHVGHQPIWTIVLLPIGTWDVFRVLRRAARMLMDQTPVRWGGREYVLERRDV